MTNRAGPEVRGVLARPSPITPTASDTWFQDCVGGDPTTGTMFEQSWFNGVLAQLRDTYTAAHPTLLPVNDSMLTRAINTIIQAGAQNSTTDTGSADALVANLNPTPFALTAGMRVFVLKSGAANSGTAPTLNLAGFGALPIRDRVGNPLAPGDLPANGLLLVELTSVGGTHWRYLGVVLADFLRIAPYTSRVQYFFSSGTFTIPAGVTSVEVEVIAGGGGGGATNNSTAGGTMLGNPGSGGGGGGYCRKKITGLTPGGTIAVTIGAAGVGVANGYGTAGGSSSFGPYCSAVGGGGGHFGSETIGNGGGGGGGIGGDINIYGGTGGFTGTNSPGPTTENDIHAIYNKGAMSSGGLSTMQLGGTGASGNGFGTGGGGASGGVGLAGGNGAPGLVIVRW